MSDHKAVITLLEEALERAQYALDITTGTHELTDSYIHGYTVAHLESCVHHLRNVLTTVQTSEQEW
jgi:hypothetical protein